MKRILIGGYMNKDIIVKYLPCTTTKEDLKKIRENLEAENTTVILIISGKEKLLDNLQSMLNVD